MKNIAFIFLGLVLLAGCKSFPMGLSQAQWDSLTPEQQADYQRQQSLMNEQRARALKAEEIQQERDRAEHERQEQSRIRKAYLNARYGDVITVTIEGGRVSILGKHQPYEPVKFDLVRGEVKQVEFVQTGRSAARNRVSVRLSEDGNSFYFDEGARDRIKLLNDGWDKGKTSGPFEIRDPSSQSMAHEIIITIRLKELPVGPTRPRR